MIVITFGVWGCDRFWDVGSAIAFGMLGVRSLVGNVGGVIAVWGCVGVRSLLGMWGAIAVWGVGVRSLFRQVTVDYLLT